MARNQMVTAFGKRIHTKSHALFLIAVRSGLTGVVNVWGYANSERMALQRVARAKSTAIGSDFEIVRLRNRDAGRRARG